MVVLLGLEPYLIWSGVEFLFVLLMSNSRSFRIPHRKGVLSCWFEWLRGLLVIKPIQMDSCGGEIRTLTATRIN